MDLTGKVAILTGAAGGLGSAQVKLFVDAGCCVIATDLRESEARKSLLRYGDRAECMAHDVTKPDDWARVVDATLDRFGRLDVLVNNAGIAPNGRMLDVSYEDYARIIEINQHSIFYGMKAVAPAMATCMNVGNRSTNDTCDVTHCECC